MLVRSLLSLCLLTSAACDDGSSTGTPDAPRVDAFVSRVEQVNCQGATIAATFLTLDTRFQPATATINRGEIVKFDTTTDHPIIPTRDGLMTDPEIRVGPSNTKCLKFIASGTFRFECMTHQYIGTLTVN